MNIPVPSAVSILWQELANQGPVTARFEPSMTKDLPEPAQLWFEHSIDNGTPLWRCIELD